MNDFPSLYTLALERNFIDDEGLDALRVLEDSLAYYGADIRQKISLRGDSICMNIEYARNHLVLTAKQRNLIDNIELFISNNKDRHVELRPLEIPSLKDRDN